MPDEMIPVSPDTTNSETSNTQPVPISRKGRRRFTTKKQRLAARKNSLKSTGPKSETGTCLASLNAFKHGSYSQSVVILPEDQQRFDSMFADYVARFAPADHVDLEFVEQMVSAAWRRRRHSSILHQYWNQAITDIAHLPENKAVSSVAIATMAHAKLIADNAPIHLLEHAELREIRKFHTALRGFREDFNWREKLKKRNEADLDLNLIP